MAAQNSFGLFEYKPSISHGDPYVKIDATRQLSKTRGKQFSMRGPKSGKTTDVYFDPSITSSVYVGAKYTTHYDLANEYAKTKKQKQIVTIPFKPSTPSNTMEGLGSYYGTFNQPRSQGPYGKFGRWVNMKATDEFDKRKPDAPRKALSPRNFYTSPSKSGHVGLLGCVKGSKGVVEEYKYELNPPQPRPKREDLKPFKPSSPAKRGLFSQEVHSTFTPLTYSNEGPPARRPKDENPPKPFRPAHVVLSRGPVGRIYGTVNPFPEYKPEGPPPKRDPAEEKAKIVGPVFRPSSTPKTMRSFSIANMPRNVTASF